MDERKAAVAYARGTITFLVKPPGTPDSAVTGWHDGPLPIPYGMEGHVTDRDLRSTYLESRVSGLLYGWPPNPEKRSQENGPQITGLTSSRRHLHLDADEEWLKEYQVVAAELLTVAVRGTEPACFLVSHVVCGDEGSFDDMCGDLVPPLGHRSSDQVANFAASVVGLVDRATKLRLEPVDRGRRQTSCFYVSPTRENAQSALVADVLWRAASLTTIERFSPISPDETTAKPIALSGDWQALALRDGVGFAWDSQLSPGDSAFFPDSTTLVRTVYTDLGLLARIQRLVLDQLANDLASIDPVGCQPAQVGEMSEASLVFRHAVWWEDVSPRPHASALMSAMQSQLASPSLFDRFYSDLRELREAVSLRELERLSLDQRRQTQLQQSQEEAQRDFARKTKVFASVAVSISLVLALLSVDIYDADRLGWINSTNEGLPLLRVLLLIVLVGLVSALVSGMFSSRSAKTRRDDYDYDDRAREHS